MSATYTLSWEKVDLPSGFFVFRYDVEAPAGWKLLSRTSGNRVATMAQFQLQKTIAAYDLPAVYPTAYIPATVAVEYFLNDVYASGFVGTHYQVIQFWEGGTLSPIMTAIPAFTEPASADGNTSEDNLVFIEKVYLDNFTVNVVRFGIEAYHGGVTEPSSYIGKSYYDIFLEEFMNKTTFLEIAGDDGIFFDGDLWVSDVGANVLEHI